MKSLQDVIYNWLTIKVVCDARPEDTAARDTMELFEGMLKDDHGLSDIVITIEDEMYYVSFVKDGEQKKQRFPRELIDIMLNQINEEPEKFSNYPEN
ncbi:hypothetical protein [Mesobacillus harenae]|uniref:hypothetical protein n=1 Tax=Mesobacillus harenae TaxID=2213203 RepID=UPI0015807B0F